MGGGPISDKLFDFYKDNSFNKPINDFLKEHQGTYGGQGVLLKTSGPLAGIKTLMWNDWWFPVNMFVFDIGPKGYPFINWMEVRPLKGGK